MNDIENNNLELLFEPENYLYFNHDDYLTDKKTIIEINFLLKNLNIGNNANLLDLACGHGRHAIGLSHSFYKITGIDKSIEFLKIAKEKALKNKIINTTFIQQDIRNINYNREYDNVILLNTVFGLFSDIENILLLQKINHSLKDNGIFCFDVINRDTLLIDFQDSSVTQKGTKDFMIDKLTFNQRTGRANVDRKYIRNNKTTYVKFSLKTYNYSEVMHLLDNAGFSIINVFSGWTTEESNSLSKKLVFITKKNA